jgi:antitoxin component YwqK of YwqJK toxin-antitoxin module
MIRLHRLAYLFFSLVFLVLLPDILLGQVQDSINPNGYNRFYYDDGTLASEGNMVDGKPDGYWKNYYPNGNIKSEGNRKNFVIDSTWKFYDEEGKINLEVNYEEGKKNGFRITYLGGEINKEHFVNDVKEGNSFVLFPSKKVKMKIPFTSGLEEGIAREYDESGNIIQLITYRKGYVVERERINRYDSDSLPHGKWKWFYADNEELLRMEGTFKHGLKDGYFKEYDREGNLLTATKFVNGEKQEMAEELMTLDVRTDYYPDGSVKVIGTYNKEGIPEGVRREYNESGQVEKAYVFRKGVIIGEGVFTDAGEKEGLWKEYYPDGKLKATGVYNKDEREGVWKFYYPSGQLEQVGAYLNGEPDSVWKWYHANGQLMREENFYNGLSDGLMTEYNADGKVIIQGDYIEGKREGKWFYDEGDNRDEGEYVEGMRNGLWESFYPDGSLSFEGKYIEDLPNGKHVWYWDNGKIKQEGNYVMGRKNGDWKKYDQEGFLAIVITYTNGKEVKYDGVNVDTEN